MKKILFIQCALLFISMQVQSQEFSGQVLDSTTQAAIPFANIYLIEHQTGTITDTSGKFNLTTKLSGRVHIQISCIGYRTSIFHLDLKKEKIKTFYLSESHLQLHEVVVSTPSIKLQQDNIISVIQKSITELNQASSSNLTEMISNIPGVDNISTGSGIGKPVIRGLSGNRIVVYAQNVRIENQQWGDEHGLGIGDAGIGNVEIIKGPASLLYGSDALGGVLYFVDEPYARQNSTEGFISSTIQSNTLGSFNDLGFKINQNGFKLNMFGSYNTAADYSQASADRALNSRFNEQNIKANLGYHYKSWISNLRYSYLRNEFGITESDSVANSTDRDALLPAQEIDNHLISFDNTIFIGSTKFSGTVAYNFNDRKEFEDVKSEPALNMLLQTVSYNLRSNTSFDAIHLEVMGGVQGMYQKNSNEAEELLIPDATIADLGAFVVATYSPINSLSFEGGLRFDSRTIDTKAMQNDEVTFQMLKRDFNNFNVAFGSSYHKKKFVIRSNIATGFRAPNTSELLSNGVHEGTLRYEIGDMNLKSEKATQLDLSFEYQIDHLNIYLNPFVNYIKNFIYLALSDTIIDDAPVFNYRQTTATLYGGEAGFHWHPHPVEWLHVESSFSTVLAEDDQNKDLPLTPANKIRSILRGEFHTDKAIKLESIFIEHIYRFEQDRVAVFETKTPGYHLINAGIQLGIGKGKNPLSLTAGVNNILNRDYIDHLSRFKLIGVENPGINVYAGFRWGWQ